MSSLRALFLFSFFSLAAMRGGILLWAQDEAQDGGDEEIFDRISFHGYGELHYNNPETGAWVPAEGDPAQMDLHRLVIGVSYEFTERILFHTEVDFEHAAKETELEFAYLDFLVGPGFNVRAGSVLMPMGPLNEYHEPPLFYSVERPYVQTYIIPTTWQEGGFGAFGSVRDTFRYRLYVVSGLDAGGFSGARGIRGGRGGVAEQPSEDLAVTGRAEVVEIPGLDAGLSFYRGGAAQGVAARGDASVGIVEGDLRLKRAGFDLRGVAAWVDIGDADRISAFVSEATGEAETIGETMLGWYVEGAYDLFLLHPEPPDQSLFAFLRFERFDTQQDTPSGLAPDPRNDRRVVTGGLSYYPHPDVALKADVERWEDGADRTGNRFNLATTLQY